jgi:hypothetical protein
MISTFYMPFECIQILVPILHTNKYFEYLLVDLGMLGINVYYMHIIGSNGNALQM